MEQTLDSIRPSTTVSEEEASYLYGRDPSILTYGHCTRHADDSKKNLISLFESVESNSDLEKASLESVSSDVLTQTVKVYLRMKPFPKKMKTTEDQERAYTIMNSTTLLTRLPCIESNSSYFGKNKNNVIVCKKFTFTQTLGPETSQLQLFEQTVKQQMINFLAGQNSTVMTYGTTNSGKSYTFHGNVHAPGLIPRCLQFMFCTINPQLEPCYKPVHYCDVLSLNAYQCAQELEEKNRLLALGMTERNQCFDAYKKMQALLQEESPIKTNQCSDTLYSVWVSFAEIYNETIYDLLTNDCQKQRCPLKLSTDHHGRSFIKGLKTICVNSGLEAYQVFMAGQYNLKIAATALNARSSRSHCIFTIKLLKYYTENNPKSVEMSTFSFCDLAGSERLKKTLNVGDRLKEAQNINTSLLVLGRCLKSIYESQCLKQKQEIVGPFRESKLTRLFQGALSGKELLSLIVHVNPAPNLYIETQNVLNFSAIARKIVVESKKPKQRALRSRFSQVVAQSIKTVTDWDTVQLENIESDLVESESTDFEHLRNYEDIINENKDLKMQIKSLKESNLNRDLLIRKELSDTYDAMMKNLDSNWREHVKNMEEQQEDLREWTVQRMTRFYEEKLSKMSNKKRKRSEGDDFDYNEEMKDAAELEAENSRLTHQILLLKETIKDLTNTNRTLEIQKNKAIFQSSLTKDCLKKTEKLLQVAEERNLSPDDDTKVYINELKSQLSEQQGRIEKYIEFLNQAKADYITAQNDDREKQKQLMEQDELLAMNADEITDLQEQVEHLKLCLQEKSNAIEGLEEKLECLNKANVDLENKLFKTLDEVNKTDDSKVLQEDELHATIEGDVDNVIANTNDKTVLVDLKDVIVQTSFADISTEEKFVQTCTGVIDSLNDTEEQLSKLKIEYTKLENQYKQECSCTEELRIQLNSMKDNIEIVTEASSQEHERDLMEKVKLEEALVVANNTNSDLGKRITEHEQQIEKLQETVKQYTTNEQNQTEKLINIEHELKKLKLKCQEHEVYISKLEEECNTAKERDELKNQCIDAHKQKVVQLERDVINVNELQQRINQLNNILEKLEKEKVILQNQKCENESKIENLEAKLTAAGSKEEELNTEISKLQKELKNVVQLTVMSPADKEMEKEMKNVLKELAESKEAHAQTQKMYNASEQSSTTKIQSLQSKIDNYEQNLKVLTRFQENAQCMQEENKKLRDEIDNLKSILSVKDQEMESFKKNSLETINKYEGLVKLRQDDLERQKREVMRYQELFRRQITPISGKEDVTQLREKLRVTTKNLEEAEEKLRKLEKKSHDEHLNSADEGGPTRRPKRGGKKNVAQSPVSSEDVIELSGSESKRITRRTALPPPAPCPEIKRSARKKKLFLCSGDEPEEFEPIESEALPSASTSMPVTRNLRNKKK
ncbi:kinesin-like protein KIF20A isoform X2 [Orussus abietinus]|nr:kinesin-like protein KIF20A isoform X2 [Orussus abietinus]